MTIVKEQNEYTLEENLETMLETGEIAQLSRHTQVRLVKQEEKGWGIVNRYEILHGPYKGGIIVTQPGSYIDRLFG